MSKPDTRPSIERIAEILGAIFFLLMGIIRVAGTAYFQGIVLVGVGLALGALWRIEERL